MRKLISSVVLIVISNQAIAKELTGAGSFYMLGLHQLLSVLAEAPLSLAFYVTSSEQTHEIKLTTAQGEVYKEIRFDHLNSIRNYITQDSSGEIKYRSNAPEYFMNCARPDPSVIKNIIDEFDMSDQLFLLRGGILSCASIAISLSNHISSYNKYGADYLKQNENTFIISYLAIAPFYLATKNKLLYILLDSNALASFLSLTVRYHGYLNKSIDTSSIPYMLISTIPTVIASSHAGIKYNDHLLKTIILLTPIFIERILIWIVSLYNE